MFELYKKEIATFFSSATGYLVAGVFLVATWLLLWVIPSDLNVIYGGYATLSPLFDVAPWIFLFLVPAVSMRLLAEERKTGTLELLLIRPVGAWRIVGAKYLAGLTLVLLSIAPTLFYVLAVSLLGSPMGNIDAGATAGSYLALILLAASYMAVGIFVSSLTDNQIVAFVGAASLSALAYVGFDMVGSVAPQADWSAMLLDLGIAAHYSSVSRGVVDSRDVFYFLTFSALFYAATVLMLSRQRKAELRTVAIVGAALAIFGFVADVWALRLDLTSEKRYTLADVTDRYVANAKGPVAVKLYLNGELNPGFRRLRRSAVELCEELDYKAGHGVLLMTEDPTELAPDDAKAFQEELAQVGLAGVPVFETKEDGQKTRTVVYPYAKVAMGDRHLWLNLLENIPGQSGEESLNRSVEGLEYKFTEAIARLGRDSVPRVAFLEGHGELDEIDVVDATRALSEHFEVDRGRVGGNPNLLAPYKVVIVAKPTQRFSEADKYALDQYAMHGGRILWLVDAVNMTLDSLRQSSHAVGIASDANLMDQLFVYGVRVRQSVVEDMSCGMVPISVPGQDGRSQVVPMPWLFSPLMATNNACPVTRNLAFVRGDFASPIDTVGEELELRRTPLMRTSAMTRSTEVPVVAQLATIHHKPRPEEFPQRHLTMAILEEGRFRSAFKRRRLPEGAVPHSQGVSELSVPTKMIFVGDGDVIRNDVRFRHSDNPTVVPLGFDEMSRQTFGNKDFIVNAVQYLADDDGLMALRNRSFELRLLDRQKISQGTLSYKLLALLAPLAAIALVGGLLALLRVRLFGRKG